MDELRASLPVVAQAMTMIHPAGEEDLAGICELRTAVTYEREDVVEAARGACGLIIVQPAVLDAAMLDQLPELAFVVAWGSGTDGFDIDAATERGIAFFSNRGVGSNGIAEYALGTMVVLLKRTLLSERAFRASGAFLPREHHGGRSVQHCTLGLVGLGFIGSHVARCASAGFGMRVLAYDPFASDEALARVGAERADLSELLAQADAVSLHTPLTPGTRGLMGSEQFAAMKDGAILVNTSRGPVVDQDALVEALASGRLGGAAIDVFIEEEEGLTMPLDHPLFAFDNVILTPHNAGFSEDSARIFALGIATNVRTGLEGGESSQLINPEVLDRRRPVRAS